MHQPNFRGRGRLRRGLLISALALAMVNADAWAQSTAGSIFGRVQPAPGQSIVVKGDGNGISRTVQPNADGRYSVGNLPVGGYSVELQQGGGVVGSRERITVSAGSGVDVSFVDAAGATELSAVKVRAGALPAIDVSNTDSRTVITAEQLAHLPLARSAEAIALLAPGAVAGSGHFQGANGHSLVAFGGSSVTENAYYINGMNVTDPLNGLGGIDLPYGAVEQQETLTGGYGAAFGRSDGGVISQIGKRGTNQWRFGGQVQWTPEFAKASPRNTYFPAASGDDAGSLYRYAKDNKAWSRTMSAYAGGPLIADRLFIFGAVEGGKTEGTSVSTNSSQPSVQKYGYDDPKAYGKLDWNIADNHHFELTGAASDHAFAGNNYDYDYDTHARGDFISQASRTKTSSRMWIGKYTGYLTDNLTLSAQYGDQKTDLYTAMPASFDPSVTAIYSASQQNPALSGGGGGITNTQNVYTIADPDHQTEGKNWRVDLTYRLGQHTINVGIDDQNTYDRNDGTSMPTDAGYGWVYGHLDNPGSEIVDGAVDAPGNYPGGGTGYYVSKYIWRTAASVKVQQRAQYIEDNWQVSDRWLLRLGLRNDQFTNYNSDGQPFVKLTKPQWAPRLGVSWDVNGDSSFKVYANAGRYYLALPTSVALRGASGAIYSNTYYTYTGIDPATGYPTGLTPIDTVNGPDVPYAGDPASVTGQAPDPKTVTSRTLKAQYQDEYIVGFDKQFNDAWTYGGKLTYRSLKNGIDDTCSGALFSQYAQDQGLNEDGVRGCYFFNPGSGATFQVPDGNGGYGQLQLTSEQLGFPKLKRDYYAMDLFVEHPFDGTWWGRLDYTFSRSYGNSEGQVKSDTGQSDIAATIDWDFPAFSEYAGGRLPNDRTHQLKAFGAWQITPEWNVSGNLTVTSGMPTSCFGRYGVDQSDPTNYGNAYHWCNGAPAPAGTAGDLPWSKILSLAIEYRPAFADHKLAFNLNLFNVFNEQHATMLSGGDDSNYRLVQGWETPRYVRLSASYDF